MNRRAQTQSTMDKNKSKAVKPVKKKKPAISYGEDTLNLRHDFTDVEFRAIAGELHTCIVTKETLEAEMKNLSQDYKARIAQQQAKQDELNAKIGNQYEMRMTKVRVMFNPEVGKKTIFAFDDLKYKKPLREEDMRPTDYQVEMIPPTGAKPVAPVAPVDGETPSNVVPMTGAVEPGAPLVPVAAALDEAEKAAAAKLEADAVEVIRSESKASVSLIQRRLKVSYAMATAIIDKLEKDGVIGPANGGEPRAILNLPAPQATGAPAHDTANPPPVPEKKKSKNRKPTKAEFEAQQEAKPDGDK